ncbi:MAG: hypothetical protein MIO93_14900 [ANME-2 cluster archaeon]|jgi:hypothetical protein|nr:hypothetical protein [ANME-2 cluster archaeon]
MILFNLLVQNNTSLQPVYTYHGNQTRPPRTASDRVDIQTARQLPALAGLRMGLAARLQCVCCRSRSYLPGRTSGRISRVPCFKVCVAGTAFG